MNSNKILLVTVNYNQKTITLDLLDSLQKCPDIFDILIIDNGSIKNEKINSQNVIKYRNIQQIYLNKNTGFTGGFNKGINYFLKNNKYEYIYIINNDTTVEKDSISSLLNIAKKYKNKYFIISPKILFYNYKGRKDIIWFGGGYYNKWTGTTKHKNLNKLSSEVSQSTNLHNDYLTGCSLFTSRKTIKKIHGFNNKFFAYSEDLDLSLRLKKINGILIYEPQSLIYHKVSITAKKYSPLSIYLQIRNSFWTTRINLKKQYLISQLLYFILIKEFIWIGIALIKANDIKLIPYIYKGFYNGIFKKI